MAREREEFEMVFSEVYPSLCRFLDCLLASRSAAEDIAQETFLQFYRQAFGRVPIGEARFWLFRVARNLALNELKRRRTRVRFFDKVVEVFRPKTVSPEAAFEDAEQRHLVLDWLASLPEPQRAALVLREQEEMSYRDIARVLAVSESKVKVDIFRARSTLRAKWTEAQTASGTANEVEYEL